MLAASESFVDQLAEKMRDPWVLFGFFAQALFGARFVVQWIMSEKKGRSYVPEIFWFIPIER